ncbi:hypothetical protein NM208_g1530 [Fusarium decemcellulare]|uniref:Uncharacterized protein n=1 Tax=Fusarium decemcellulare TaxID=57161 RepID=A0ACC1SVT7_9HYPO|nr:hypothetical protein NM208_g1530 [Fusarium decemcellulare]
MADLSTYKHGKRWPWRRLRRRLGLWPILPKSFQRLQVSLPNALIHVSHVTHDKATGEFHGLPAEWQRLMAIDEEQGESRPTAIIEVLTENTAPPAQAVRVPPSSTIARQGISLTRSASIVAPLNERMPGLVRNGILSPKLQRHYESITTSRWMKVLISRSKEKKHSASPNFANKEHNGDLGSTGNGPISKTNKTSTFNNQLPNRRSRLRSKHTTEQQRHSRVAQSNIQHYKEGHGNRASHDQRPFYMTEPRALEQFSSRERTLTQASLSDNSESQTSFTLPIQHPEPMALSKHFKGARVNEYESIADLFKFKDPEQVFYDLTEIAQGAFGRIYAGSKRGFDGILAIKQVRLKNEATVRLTAKEIKASSDVSHLNIVQFIGTYVWADQVWMIMEFVNGGTLTDVISLNSLKEGEIATICSQILQAVQCLHTSGFIHRDIKSDNVLLSRNGVVKLCK